MVTRVPQSHEERLRAVGALLLGFALGGFFDGILLHQILQWHHLLSGLDAPGMRDLRVQVIADGVFHGLMYVIAIVGLTLLYRVRRASTTATVSAVLAPVLFGFGLWHVIDAVLSHWLTGIHRIRMDVPEPLWWDLGWLGIFGVVPVAAALFVRRRDKGHGVIVKEGRGGGTMASVAVLTLAAAFGSALPPTDQQADTLTIVLRPDVRAADFWRRMENDNARVLWSDRAGAVWVVKSDTSVSRMRFYSAGAMYVSGSLFPAGCTVWLKT
jgi:uncharacterized membrane protein